MRRAKTCKIDGCDLPPERGALLCPTHLGEKRRCSGQVKMTDDAGEPILDSETGEQATRRCKKPAKPGLTVCKNHGGGSTRQKAISARTGALTAMQRFVQPYEGDLSPVSAFEKEYRRTYGRIMWLEKQIGGLETERDLIFGLTKTEEVGATEFAGTNKTYEARIHVFEDMLRWERKHFLDLTKVWIKAGLEEKKLGMIQSSITYTQGRVFEVARALGHDPDDPATLDKIASVFKHEERDDR